MELKIGKKLNDLRKEKGYSISKLSEISGVSTGLISQIERDMVIPSVVNLWKLAEALDTNINFFFEEENKNKITLLKSGSHKKIISGINNDIYTLLNGNSNNRTFDLIEVTLNPGDNTEDELLSHDGEECGYVISGTLTVKIDNEKYILTEGDSIYFDSNSPHKYMNTSQETCVSMWAMTPKFF